MLADKEIDLDPELTQDLLDILNDGDMEEDEGDQQLEQYEGAVAAAAAFVGSFKRPPSEQKVPDDMDYLDNEQMESEFYSCDDNEKEFTGDVEDDPEMAEMLKMLEEAEGDLEGAGDDELAHLMDSFDTMEAKKSEDRKKSLKRPVDNTEVQAETDKKVKKSDDRKKSLVKKSIDSQKVSETAQKAKSIDESILRPVPSFLSGITIAPDAEEQGVSFEDEAKVEVIATPLKGNIFLHECNFVKGKAHFL